MARRHYAKAMLSRSNVPFEEWMDVIRDQHEGAVPKNQIHRISKSIHKRCDPNQYLLSHTTIVASVDTHSPKNVKIGNQLNRGVQIEVKWPDYRINKECKKYTNNNMDSWSRPLLLSTYRTFIGAPNYLEHIQIPELSKGFVVDAIARDLGETCYIDLLVATDRKHDMLIHDILSGEIDSFSMGCVSLFTLCTKCGNVSADDSQSCPCILYDLKGSKYLDEDGCEQIVSELIGHVSVPNSNQFIEASWVRKPAFVGAQRRNFLNEDPTKFDQKLSSSKAFFDMKSSIPIPDGTKKAASIKIAQGEDQQGEADPPEPDESDASIIEEPEEDSPSSDSASSESEDIPVDKAKFNELLEKAQTGLMEVLVKNIQEKLAPKPEDVSSVTSAPADLTSGNDNLVRASKDFENKVVKVFAGNKKLIDFAVSSFKKIFSGSIRTSGMSQRDLLVFSWIEDRVNGKNFNSSLYKIAMKTGSIKNYPSEVSYIAACKMGLGREITEEERKFLIRKGHISSLSKF